MASAKKFSGAFWALLFLLTSVPILRADDAVLFDDNDLMVVADPQEGNVPAAAPTAPPADPAAPAEQPAPAGQPAPAEPPEGTFQVDLEPREIPEVFPGQPGPAAEPGPETKPEPAAAPEAAPEAGNGAAPGGAAVPLDSPAGNQPAPSAEPNPAEPSQETETAPAGEEIELVKILVSPPDSVLEQIHGQPTALADVLNGVTAPAERQRITETYWDVAEALALYHLSLISAGDIEDCITRFTQQGTPSESQTAVLISARRLASQRSAEAKIALAEAQCRLAEIGRQNGASNQTIRLAIPTDAPNTLPYQTRFERINREKRLSPQAAYYAEAIPAYYEMMTMYNKAASDALEAFRTLYFTGGISAETLLSAADKLNDAKERLIRSVSAYNKMISAYVAETVGPDVSGQRLISTMIRVPDRSSIPNWNAAQPTRVASAVPIPTQYSPRRPRPVSAEIPQFDSSAAPNPESGVRPDQNAEMLR
ncbi:MAG: hypothetical protein J6S40_05995 [Thermoguttaceae bacterium]|nr:hypothetical protein [Thermoguttaceae bacterium]